MFKNSAPSTSLDCSLKGNQGVGLSQATSVIPNNNGCSGNLNVPLYNTESKSSCVKVEDSFNCGKTETSCGSSNWQGQVTTFVSQYTVTSASYGGTVTTASYGGAVTTASYGGGVETSCKHFNQGIGNGTEGGDPGNSHPHGGSNDEGGRTPGERWIPKIFSGLGF